MKITKLDHKGISHVIVPLVVVVLVALVGVYLQVSSHADPGNCARGYVYFDHQCRDEKQMTAYQVLHKMGNHHIGQIIFYEKDQKQRTTPYWNLVSTYRGRQANTTRQCAGRDGERADNKDTNISTNLLKFMNELGSETDYTVSSIVGQCHSKNSSHYKGEAVDIACPFSDRQIGLANKIAQKYGIKHNNESCSPEGHYHYSIGGN